MSEASFFAIQVFLPLIPGHPLRPTLADLVRAAPEQATPEMKRHFYSHVVGHILAPWHAWEFGNWDYSDDDEEARTEYVAWCEGTVQDAREQEEELQQQAALHGPYRSIQKTYLFLTILLLMEQGMAADRIIGPACQIPEPMRWRKDTFHRLFSLIPTLPFESIRSDAIYLCPGHDDHGLALAELQTDRYDYIRPLG